MRAVSLSTAAKYMFIPFVFGASFCYKLYTSGTSPAHVLPQRFGILDTHGLNASSTGYCSPSCKMYDYKIDECSMLGEYSPADPECLTLTEPTNFIRILRELVLGLPIAGQCNRASDGGCSVFLPYNDEQRNWGVDWPPFGYSMMGRVRLENFRAAIEDVNRKSIPGAIVELGVWRGGGMMYAAGINRESYIKRKIYVYDAFENIKSYGPHSPFLNVDEAMVSDSFRALGLLDSYVHFKVGLFKDTLPNWTSSEKIAVLRVDGNFYDSYQDAMYFLYESVPVNGIVIFDDVLSHKNVMDFWKEFSSEQNIGNVNLVSIDKHSAWFRKPKKVFLDWRFFKAYRDSNQEDTANGCPKFVDERTGGRCHESWKS